MLLGCVIVVIAKYNAVFQLRLRNRKNYFDHERNNVFYM